MRVAVLGSGPSGMVAVHAAAMAGADNIVVYTKRRKSTMFGAQYLHAPIPGVNDTTHKYLAQPRPVRYVLRGTPESYRLKVYGPTWDGTVSPEDLAEFQMAWDIRLTYEWLLNEYSDAFLDDIDLYPFMVKSISESYDLVISTIPAPILCTEGHTFRSTDIWAAGEAPERGVFIPYQAPQDTVVCDGTEDVSWYRLSNIFDRQTVEWSKTFLGERRPPIPGVSEVRKPLTHNCTCFPRVVRVGRYGAWQKGILVHHVYHAVMAAYTARLHELRRRA
jgi:hypothetical protein